MLKMKIILFLAIIIYKCNNLSCAEYEFKSNPDSLLYDTYKTGSDDNMNANGLVFQFRRSIKSDNTEIEARRRSTLDKNFMRFGRSDKSLMRFGRPDQNLMRFGRSDGSYVVLDKPYKNLLRLSRQEGNNNFMRFGRNQGFLRFGRKDNNNFIRFGRNSLPEDASDAGDNENDGAALESAEENPKQSINANANNATELEKKSAQSNGDNEQGGADNVEPTSSGDRQMDRKFRNTDSDKNLMRFGRGNTNMMRFGRPDNNLMRFGRPDSSMMRFGRADKNLMRFGRPDNNLMRFGRAGANSNLMRFGRPDSNLMRFGRPDPNLMRFGRADQNLMRFGRPDQNLMRFGRPDQNLMRFGRANGNLMRFGRPDPNLMRFGRSDANDKRFRIMTTASPIKPNSKVFCVYENKSKNNTGQQMYEIGACPKHPYQDTRKNYETIVRTMPPSITIEEEPDLMPDDYYDDTTDSPDLAHDDNLAILNSEEPEDKADAVSSIDYEKEI